MTINERHQHNQSKIEECRHKSDEMAEIIELLQKNWVTRFIYRDEILRLQEKQIGLLSMSLTYAGLK